MRPRRAWRWRARVGIAAAVAELSLAPMTAAGASSPPLTDRVVESFQPTTPAGRELEPKPDLEPGRESTPELNLEAIPSSLRSSPYRRGLELTASLGPAYCLPTTGRGCVPESASALRPDFMFDVGVGYRLGRHVSLGGAVALATRLLGFRDPELTRQRRRDLLGFGRLWWPLRRSDFGIGVSGGRREHTLHFGAEAAVAKLEYTGWTWRPALLYRHWILADYAIGAKLEGMFAGNAGICVYTHADERACATDLGPVPPKYRQTVSHGLVFAIEAAGVATPY